MARVCSVCGKGAITGHNVPHSQRKTKRRWLPNLQSVRALVKGTPKRVRVCTSCLRAGRVTRVVNTGPQSD